MITMSPFIMAAKKQSVSPDIWYDWSYVRDAGDVKLDNLGTLDSQYDATAYVCAGCEFTGTQLVDVPLDYSLGEELVDHLDVNMDTTGDFTISGNEIEFDITSKKDQRPFVYFYTNGARHINTSLYKFSFDYEKGTISDMTFNRYYFPSVSLWKYEYNNLSTSQKIEFYYRETSENDIDNFRATFNSYYVDDLGTFTTRNFSWREVTFQTKSLWIYDYSDNTWHITTDDQFTDVKYRIENRTIGHFFTLNTTHTQDDVDLLNANPELALNLVLGDTDTGLSFTKDDIGAYYQPDVHNGKYVWNLIGVSDNQIINGDFETDDLSNWSTYSDAVLEIENGRAKLYSTVADDTYGGVTYTIPTPGNYTHIAVCIDDVEYNGNTYNLSNVDYPYGDAPEKRSAELTGGDVKITIGIIQNQPRYFDNVKAFFYNGLTIQNYTDEAYTNADQQTKGIPLTAYKQDELGRIIEKADTGMGEFNGDGRYIEIPTRTTTTKITTTLKPKTIDTIDLISTATGTVTINADGTVTTSSGTTTIDTTTLQADTESVLTISGISIDGASKIAENFNGILKDYKEENQ